MKGKLLVIGLLVATILLGGCSKAPVVVKLPQEIIDQAVLNLFDKPYWSLGILDVTTGTAPGVTLEAAVVLHNGSDCERLVNLSYTPMEEPITKDLVKFVPLNARAWVTISSKEVRLGRNETKVIPVTLLIPKGTKVPVPDWSFGITAEGSSISTQDISLLITTENSVVIGDAIVPDNFLEVSLVQPPMKGSISSVKSVTSSIGEKLSAVSYDKVKRVLRIEGLNPSSTRVITLVYESLEMVNIAYVQQWYVSKLK